MTWRESGGVLVREGREGVSPRSRGVLAGGAGDSVLGLVAAVGVGLSSLKDGSGDDLRASGCQHLQAGTVLNKDGMLRNTNMSLSGGELTSTPTPHTTGADPFP